MGKELSTKKALKQYDLINRIYNRKGFRFFQDVTFQVSGHGSFGVRDVPISLTGYHYGHIPYYSVGIEWEEAEHEFNSETANLLESLHSKSASTNYQKMRIDGVYDLVIENEGLTICIDIS